MAGRAFFMEITVFPAVLGFKDVRNDDLSWLKIEMFERDG